MTADELVALARAEAGADAERWLASLVLRLAPGVSFGLVRAKPGVPPRPPKRRPAPLGTELEVR